MSTLLACTPPQVAHTGDLGLRQGEVFGLAEGDIDFLRRVVTVRRQVCIVGSRLVFSLPKNSKIREVPLPGAVAAHLAQHMSMLAPVSVTLPWDEPTGSDRTARLIVTSRGAVP